MYAHARCAAVGGRLGTEQLSQFSYIVNSYLHLPNVNRSSTFRLHEDHSVIHTVYDSDVVPMTGINVHCTPQTFQNILLDSNVMVTNCFFSLCLKYY